MTFDETLYGRDDEMDEYGDSGAYGDSLEEDYEEEEEEGRSKGAIKLEGKMIDAVHYKQAKAILEIAETAKGSTIA